MNTLVLALVAGYLMGSVPFAYLMAMWLKGVDPRTVGDGNPGAKNTFLYVSRKAGVLAGICDILKGLLVITTGRLAGLEQMELFALGFAVVMGHNYPVFLNFQGGQGMATTVGVLFGLATEATLVGFICFLAGLLILRNWDLSCGIGFVMIPITSYFWRNDMVITVYSVLLIPVIGIRKLVQVMTGRVENHHKP